MPGGLDAATMQQILGGAGAKGAVSKKGSTPRKGGAAQQSLPQTSIPNLDIKYLLDSMSVSIFLIDKLLVIVNHFIVKITVVCYVILSVKNSVMPRIFSI